MTDKVCIGRCSICGGRVMQYTVLWIVGPWPPARCESCGATEEAPEKVIPMRPVEPDDYWRKRKWTKACPINDR